MVRLDFFPRRLFVVTFHCVDGTDRTEQTHVSPPVMVAETPSLMGLVPNAGHTVFIPMDSTISESQLDLSRSLEPTHRDPYRRPLDRYPLGRHQTMRICPVPTMSYSRVFVLFHLAGPAWLRREVDTSDKISDIVFPPPNPPPPCCTI